MNNTKVLEVFTTKSHTNSAKKILSNNKQFISGVISDNNAQMNTSNYAGKIKHFTPANKEWFNSIYAFSKNAIKLLPSIDKNVSKLIKAYFNSYSRKLEKKVKKLRSRRYLVRKLRLSTNGILVSRAELKHSNDKVIVTVYIYNSEKKYLFNKIKKIPSIDQIGGLQDELNSDEQLDFIVSKANKYINNLGAPITKKVDNSSLDNVTINNIYKLVSKNPTTNKLYSFFSEKFRQGYFFSELPIPASFVVKENIENTNIENKIKVREFNQYIASKKINKDRKSIDKNADLSKLLVKNLSNKSLNLISKMRTQKRALCLHVENKNLKLDVLQFNAFEKKYMQDFVSKLLRKEITSVYFKQLMSFNKLKFEKRYISPLVGEVEKIYNKKVEFNFVNLKYLYLSGSILSTALITKMKNRKNKFLRAIDNSLLMFNLPAINRQVVYDEIYNKKKVIQNPEVRNRIVKYNADKIQGKHKTSVDVLDKSVFNMTSETGSELINSSAFEVNTYAYKLARVINLLKHKSVTGIRIEVAGRLTKRNTAARSLFKVRYKGNVRNVDSSDKGLSAVMLRGHAKSNLEYTNIHSKIRIGSYGLKGWVSSG